MTASYRLIDYSVRQAKHAERRMLCDMFRKLVPFGELRHYQYVGFGAIWFADFSLFHRNLGIDRMCCIEREVHHAERFRYNCPFGGIELMFGPSSQELPKIDWGVRTIAWLDYDDPLNPQMLEDVRTVAGRMCSGSVLVVSVQAHNLPKISDPESDSSKEVETVAEFRALFGPARTPTDLAQSQFFGRRLATVYRKCLSIEVDEALRIANSGKRPGSRMKAKQVFSVEYADGARMTTLGFVFFDEGQEGHFDSCGFRNLSFYRDSEETLKIEVPKLTPKEMREIERKLPFANPEDVGMDPVPQSEVRVFSEFYRYLPRMAAFEP